MANFINELKDAFNLEATFDLGDPKEFVGKLDDGKEVLERINLVLTQTFDAIGALPFRQLIVKGKDKKVVIVYYRNSFLGIVAKKDENVENILKYIYEKGSLLKPVTKEKEEKVERAIIEKEREPEVIEQKVEEAKKKEVEEEVVEEKEVVREEVVSKAVEKVEIKETKEEIEEVKEIVVKKEFLSTKVLDSIEKIAANYLGDFSLDIVSNVIEDSGIDKSKPTKDQVLGIAQSLKDAASLIIGPTKAKKLNEDILKNIEEVG